MRRYDSSRLYKSDQGLFIDISKQLYELAGFNRFSLVTASLTKLTSGREVLLDKSDRFSLNLIPFSRAQVKRLFYVSLAIPSRPNTLAALLEFFRLHNIDILECRSVDRKLEEGGMAELLVSVDPEFMEEVQEKDQRGILEKGLFEHLNRKDILIESQMLTVEQPLLGDTVRWLTQDPQAGFYFNAEFSGRTLSDLIQESQRSPGRYAVRIPDGDRELYRDISQSPDDNYVVLIFDDRSNLLQAIFKDPGEIIVSFEAIFKNISGQLEKLVGPLGRLAVDLRLINPLVLDIERSEADPSWVPYVVVANVQHTKFRLFDLATILEITKAEAALEAMARDNIRPIITLAPAARDDNLPGIALNIVDCAVVDRFPVAQDEQKMYWILLPPAGFHSLGNGDQHDLRFLVSLPNRRELLFFHLFLDLPKSISDFALGIPSGYDSLGLRRFAFGYIRDLATGVFDSVLISLAGDSLENLPDRFRNSFLASASDTIYGVFLTIRALNLCDLVKFFAENIFGITSDTGGFAKAYQDLKYGLIPYVRERGEVYQVVDSGARFAPKKVGVSEAEIFNQVKLRIEEVMLRSKERRLLPNDLDPLMAASESMRLLLYPKPKPSEVHANTARGYRDLS